MHCGSAAGGNQNLDLNLGIAPLSLSNGPKENVESSGFYLEQVHMRERERVILR